MKKLLRKLLGNKTKVKAEPKPTQKPKWKYPSEDDSMPEEGQVVEIAVTNGNVSHPMAGGWYLHKGRWMADGKCFSYKLGEELNQRCRFLAWKEIESPRLGR